MGRKLSIFNAVVEIEGKTFLFNTRTHAVLEGEMCRRLLDHGATGLLELQEARLAAKGILVPEELPEAEALQVYFMRRKFFTHYTLLTVSPTYRCNCACPDCPQLSYDQSTAMDEATVEGVAKLLDHVIEERRPSRVAYWLSGGEPFVSPDVSLRLSQRIEEVCAHKQVGLKQSITTNGTLLNHRKARSLIDHIDEFYVSLAESEQAQRQQRPFANQRNSYQAVLEGLSLLAELNKKTTVRFNVSSEEGVASRLRETISDIHSALGRAAYPGLFFQFNVLVPRSSCADGWHITPGAVTGQLDRLLPSLKRLTGETPWPSENFLSLPNTAHMAKTPPLTPGQELRICDYHKGDGFHVTPTGDVWACSMYAEQKPYWFGQVKDDPKVFENPKYLRFIDFDPFEDSHCRDCVYLPMCLRRCPISTYRETGPHRWSEDGCEAAVRARIVAFLRGSGLGVSPGAEQKTKKKSEP